MPSLLGASEDGEIVEDGNGILYRKAFGSNKLKILFFVVSSIGDKNPTFKVAVFSQKFSLLPG